ncbi:MAG TPA: GNAT family N-acetyltransferase [Myxococcaceae bacterium]|nr:GNAT family N-acetyltransferase [Myxococcaceae bacterium]
MASAEEKQISIVPVTSDGELLQALAIREIVFIEEQHAPEGFERDANDSRAYHVLAFDAGHAIGTGRLVALSKPPADESGPWCQVSRMAVLQAHRSGGVGSRLLDALEAEAGRQQMAGVTLHAPLSSIDFYKKRGYQPVGGVFQEAGMPHLEMRKRVSHSRA